MYTLYYNIQIIRGKKQKKKKLMKDKNIRIV